jgi:hypothetical protein
MVALLSVLTPSRVLAIELRGARGVNALVLKDVPV